MAQATDVMSKAAMYRTARWLAFNVPVNSGALVQIDPEMEVGFVIEPSASSHVYPRRRYSAEAPRVHGDEVTIALWREWVEHVIEMEVAERDLEAQSH